MGKRPDDVEKSNPGAGFREQEKSLCEDLTHGDDLGRVVIPKEIRRTLKIREGMPMEIFTDVSGEPQLDELVQGKRPFTTPGQNTVPVAQGVAAEALAVFPLVAEGDPMGAVLLLKGERSPKQLDAGTLESLRAAAMFLSRQLEV